MAQQIINMRNYSINKYKGNTHYSVFVTDNYGRERGNFFRELQECYDFVYKIWENEKPLTNKEIKNKLLSDAISNCIKLDNKLSLVKENQDNLD